MPIVRQANFAGGEVDPLLYGRTDHPKYRSFVRQLVNFIASPQGAAKNRAGTKFVASVKTSSVSPRLIPFIWPTQNYVLEFGNLYVRFFSNGGVVGAPLEVVTPFTTAMLPYLKYAQKDDTLIICYGGQEPGGTAAVVPQALQRIAHTNWTLTSLTFAVQAPSFISTPIVNARTSVPTGVPDATHLARDWVWQVTQLLQDATGNRIESSPITVRATSGNWGAGITYAAGNFVLNVADGKTYTSLVGGNIGNQPDTSPNQWVLGVVLFPDRQLQVVWNSSNPFGFTIVGHSIYRGIRGGPLGLVGETSETGIAAPVVFQDVAADPDFTQQPPQSTDPFLLPSGAHDWPACVTHFQQRRTFARQPLHLGRIQASKTGQRTNFDTTLPSLDSDALNFDLDSQSIEEIRSLVSLRSLIALTSTGAQVVHGSGNLRSGGVAIAPSSVDATRQSNRGASWVDPVVVDNAIVFAQAKGSAIRALAYDPYWGVLGNPGSDIAIVAQHLLRAHTVVRMAYQEAPDSIIWAPREDGVLLGITFVPSSQPDQQTYGWHQHPTDGAFEDVCCVPEGTEDAAYFIVRRTVNGATVRYVERMNSRVLPLVTVPDPKDPTKTVTREDARFGVFLDAALSFDGRNVGATTMQFVSDAGTYAGGEQGTITASAAAFAASDPEDVLMFDPNGTAGGPFRLTILSFTDTTHVRAILDAPLPETFRSASTAWAFGRKTMTGLAHLEAKAVTVLADGAVQGPFTVVAGAIRLDVPAAVVLAGLPYNSDMELLDVAPDAVRPNVKSVSRVFFEIVASRGIWVGEDANGLQPWKQRTVANSFGAVPVATDIAEVGIRGSWNKGGRAFIRQVDPLPLTIDAVSRDVTVGGS
jgi:hypothetical protein